MDKRGIAAGAVFVIVGSVLLIGMLGFLGIKVMDIMSKDALDVLRDSFYIELKDSVRSMAADAANPAGSVNMVSIRVPPGASSVCFFDETKEFELGVDPELNRLILADEGYDVFVKPLGRFAPDSIGDFRLADDSHNPLCLYPRASSIYLSLEASREGAIISAQSIDEVASDCTLVRGRGNHPDQIDILYVGQLYGDRDKYEADVLRYIESFLSYEPFSSEAGKFSFYRMNNAPVLDCKMGSFISCDNSQIQKIASGCPHDFIVVLFDRNRVLNTIDPVRSSAIGTIAKVNTADEESVFMHEFGHLFGNLADEYTDDRYYLSIGFDPAGYPNCDTVQGCPSKWEDILGVSCYEGCSLSGYYRGTQDSIMRSLSAEFFGPVNEKVISEQLGVYE